MNALRHLLFNRYTRFFYSPPFIDREFYQDNKRLRVLVFTIEGINLFLMFSPRPAGKSIMWSVVGGLMLFANVAIAQADDRFKLLKVGAFVYVLESKYNGYSVHAEFEKVFRKAKFLTSGPRIDYTHFKYSNGAFMVAYDMKFYPFYWISHKPCHGIFLGIDAAYLVQNTDSDRSRYGPGLGGLFGYQYLFKDKLTLGVEGSMIYLQDLNDNAIQHNPKQQYLYVFANLKAGFRLGPD